MTSSSTTDRLSTGIVGLDRILEGGFLRNAVYIAEGPPGAGKTMLASQLCFHNARQGERALYVTLLAESHERMLTHLSRMDFYDPALVPDGVYFISAFRALHQDGLPALLRLLRDAIIERKATVLVLDGMVTAEEISLARAPSANALTQDAGSSQHFKQFIHELQSVCSMTSCTVLLLSSTERPRLFHPAYTMVDGILELTNELAGLKTIRQIHVRKMRGTDQVLGKHAFDIGPAGVVVHPRIESLRELEREETGDDATADDAPRIPFGIPQLDTMLSGGLPERSVTMIVGPTGTGKTLLGLQYLAEGARRGEPGVYFGFFERPSALLTKSRRLSLGLDEGERAGLVEIVWQRPIEAVIDVLADRLFTTVRKLSAKRLVLDGIQGFEQALDDYPDRLRGVFASLTDELERLGVTTLYTVETRELFGPTIEIPVSGVSAATQNIILTRHVELQSRLNLLLSIIKVRDSHFDRTVRELVIGDGGLHVADAFGADTHVLAASALQPIPSPPPRKQKRSRPAAAKQSTAAAPKPKTPARKTGKRKR
ncbi:MAG: ATPase domain-containing protein [Polyangiales bacterium]